VVIDGCDVPCPAVVTRGTVRVDGAIVAKVATVTAVLALSTWRKVPLIGALGVLPVSLLALGAFAGAAVAFLLSVSKPDPIIGLAVVLPSAFTALVSAGIGRIMARVRA